MSHWRGLPPSGVALVKGDAWLGGMRQLGGVPQLGTVPDHPKLQATTCPSACHPVRPRARPFLHTKQRSLDNTGLDHLFPTSRPVSLIPWELRKEAWTQEAELKVNLPPAM